jgi:hypothetical protein
VVFFVAREYLQTPKYQTWMQAGSGRTNHQRLIRPCQRPHTAVQAHSDSLTDCSLPSSSSVIISLTFDTTISILTHNHFTDLITLALANGPGVGNLRIALNQVRQGTRWQYKEVPGAAFVLHLLDTRIISVAGRQLN